MNSIKRIVILASGSGSNAENIINYFRNTSYIEVSTVLTNKNTAPVIHRCKRLKVPVIYFNKEAFTNTDVVLDFLVSQQPDLIVLAGFLWKIPEKLVSAFPNKIVNIHPALLPKYGGKGMYGENVHKAVKGNKETETGITIHFVNENYDEGAIIHQAKTKIAALDTVEIIAEKVHALEYEHFPKVLEKLLLPNG
jgi:phosphoribosylglycinamide formyltransferase-1